MVCILRSLLSINFSFSEKATKVDVIFNLDLMFTLDSRWLPKFKFLPFLENLKFSAIDHFCKKKSDQAAVQWFECKLDNKNSNKNFRNISSLTLESNSRPWYDFLDKSSTMLQSAVLHPLMGKTIWFLKNICCTIHCTLLCADKFSSGKNSLTHLFMRQSEMQSEY